MAPLRGLADLSERLIAARRERGSLDFDLPESRVILDERGLPIDIQRIERLAAHRLVESFMLLANETVAKKLRAREWPTLYRVHEPPDPMSTEELRQSLARLGIRLPKGGKRGFSPRMLQTALAEAEGQPAEQLINTLVLRSMKRAIYHPEPRGHFGLAARNYCHFTSPIRRYPDLVVHRVLRAVVRRGKPPIEDPVWMERAGEHCSERERIAEEAERASVELKKVQLMSEHIGERFEGKVVGVTAFGFFVEPDTYHVQGLVHVNRLEDDYYHFDSESLTLLGERTGRSFKLGDRVEVEVSRTDIARRQIDFDLVSVRGRKRER
jgi:ribonuclease R